MPDIHAAENITVIVVDDHAVVRKGLLAFFNTTEDIRVVATAATAREAVAATKEYCPRVVVLDLLLPDQPAARTIELIKAASPLTQVLMLTSHEGSEYIAEVCKAGAISYVLKDISPEDLILAVRKAATGEGTLTPRLGQTLAEDFSGSGKNMHGSLTEREHEVVLFIARGMTNAEIAEQLFISETTVKSHVSSILAKLSLADRTKVAVYAWEKGLIRKSG